MPGSGEADTAERPFTETRVRLHELTIRPDGDEFLVGRLEARNFVALPAVGVRALELLGQDRTVRETAEVLRAECGEDVDVADFVEDLKALEFVREQDGQPVPTSEVRPASLPWLRPRHVRFSLSPVLPVVTALAVLAALGAVVFDPDISLGYRSLLWSSHGSVNLLFMVVAELLVLMAHEGSHLVTARAAGVPGRFSLGTRLQFLVAQTDISGIELAPRRHRITAYLSGIGLELLMAATAVLVLPALDAGALPHRLVSAFAVLALLPLTFQLMVFMRTDVYFVVQDLTRCRDLFGDSFRYNTHLLRRLLAVLPGRKPAGPDPSVELPPRERRVVRAYSVVQGLGTVLCLATLLVITLPAKAHILADAVTHLGPGHSLASTLDAVAVLTMTITTCVLWIIARRASRRRKRALQRPASS